MKPVTLFLLAFALVACGPRALGSAPIAVDPAGRVQSTTRTASVTLDVYSGRPNPTWTLSSQSTAELLALVATLPATAPTTLPDGLGYRGFGVAVSGAPADQPLSFTAAAGIVRLGDGPTATFRADPERRVERWLLHSAGSSLDPALAATVSQAISEPTSGAAGSQEYLA